MFATLAHLRQEHHEIVAVIMELLAELERTSAGAHRQAIADEIEAWQTEAASLDAAYRRLAGPLSAEEHSDGQVEGGF